MVALPVALPPGIQQTESALRGQVPHQRPLLLPLPLPTMWTSMRGSAVSVWHMHSVVTTGWPASLWRPGGLALGSNAVHQDRLLRLCPLQACVAKCSGQSGTSCLT